MVGMFFMATALTACGGEETSDDAPAQDQSEQMDAPAEDQNEQMDEPAEEPQDTSAAEEAMEGEHEHPEGEEHPN